MHEPTEPPAVTTILARLIRDIPLSLAADDCRNRAPVYRPLIVGPVILRKPAQRGDAWRVSLEPGDSVRPKAPTSRGALLSRVKALRGAGVACRVAAALVAPQDIVAAHNAAQRGRAPRRASRCRSEFYGWSLLYHPPGAPRIGLVEPHAAFPDLPAFFESPLELLERSEFLAGRGVRSRPIALFTQPEDFAENATGVPVNRYFPHGTFRGPSRLDWLE